MFTSYRTLLQRTQQRTILGLVAAATTLAASGSLYANTRLQEYPHNLNAALDYYGFSTSEQKKALRDLMRKAGIKNVDALLVRKAKSPDELTRTILALVRETQEKFAIRTGKQERWDVETSDWMKDPKQQTEVLSALETLNMMDAVSPTFKKSDAICVLGASKSLMDARLDYAGKLVTENTLLTNWLIMLAGERYVTPDKNGIQVDGSEQELKVLADKLGKDMPKLTETDLMRAGYENSALRGKFPDNRVVLIDTPRGDLPRPTTETTVTALCEWLKQHPEVREMTFISNQPHVAYQGAVIAQVFEKQGVKLKFETIGSEYIPVVNSDADKINYVLQALGSRIWATTPGAFDAMGIEISPELRAEYMALYKKMPLIYGNIGAKLARAKM